MTRENWSDWSEEKNRRRCQLIDKEINDELTCTEQIELLELQDQMLAYRAAMSPRMIWEVQQ